MKDILNTMTSTTKMLTYLLGSIAAISLLVGGIGIMNTYLISNDSIYKKNRDAFLKHLLKPMLWLRIGVVCFFRLSFS